MGASRRRGLLQRLRRTVAEEVADSVPASVLLVPHSHRFEPRD
jgi:hypothetical protein